MMQAESFKLRALFQLNKVTKHELAGSKPATSKNVILNDKNKTNNKNQQIDIKGICLSDIY